MTSRLSRHLCMLGVSSQKLTRGGISAAYLQMASTGFNDAVCRLFAVVERVLLERSAPPGTLPALDALQPEVLAERLRAQLAAIPALSDPGLDAGEQDGRRAAILGLRASANSDLGRECVARAQATVRGDLDRIRTALLKGFADAPNAVRDLASTVRAALEQTRQPEVNAKPLTLWLERRRIADKVRQRRSALPVSTQRVFQELLTSEGRLHYDACLRALALDLTGQAWRAEIVTFLEFLDDLNKRGTELLLALRAVKAHLADIRAQAAADQEVSRASIVLKLAGPSEDQVVAGLVAHLHTADEMDLGRRLLDDFEARLRQVCPVVCAWIDGRVEPLPELIRNIPPDAQAAQFLAAVEHAMGPGQSLYEIIERDGIKKCAQFLFERSEPTVHLSGRDMAQVGLSPTYVCIVTLPEPAGPKDSQILEDLRAALKHHDRDCAFSAAPATDRTVTAVRLVVGYPIGVEAQNGSLLDHYQRCAEYGHLPHLFDLLPASESRDGAVIDAYLALFPADHPLTHGDIP